MLINVGSLRFNSKHRNFKLFNIRDLGRDLTRLNRRMLVVLKVKRTYDKRASLISLKISKPKAEWYTDYIRMMVKERNRRLTKYKKY
nr:unnamed protein product [Callosobruchus analis]